MTENKRSTAPRHRRRPLWNHLWKKISVAILCVGMSSCWDTAIVPSLFIGSAHALSVSIPLRGLFLQRSGNLERTTTRNRTTKNNNNNINSALHMAPQSPQPRQPRRMLKKRTSKEGDKRQRRNNRRRNAGQIGSILPGILPDTSTNDSGMMTSSSSTQEYRPLIPSIRRESGEDYWIDPKDLEKEQRKIEEQRQQQELARLSRGKKNSISPEKLMTEVKAPYRQNWIGYFSLVVAILSMIVSQFPELLEPAPTMKFPTDL